MNRRNPDILYKYYPPERRTILSDLLVRFSQLSALNDPFEFAINLPGVRQITLWSLNPISTFVLGFRTGFQAVRESEITPRLSIIVRATLLTIIPPMTGILSVLLLPFLHTYLSKIMLAAGDELEELIRVGIRNGLLLVFSCCEAWDSVPLWAHYAGNHTGFAIGLDPSCAFRYRRGASTEYLSPRRVKYQDKMPSVRSGSLDRLTQFMATKMSHWSYEREWRFTRPPDGAVSRGQFALGSEVLLFELEKESIREVVFGARCDPGHAAEALEAIASAGIAPKIYRIQRGTKYGFERVPMTHPSELQQPDSVALVPDVQSLKWAKVQAAFGDIAADARDRPLLRRLFGLR